MRRPIDAAISRRRFSAYSVVATDLIDGMAVDVSWRLYYNDVRVARHTVERNATLPDHEVGTLLRDHEARKKVRRHHGSSAPATLPANCG